EVIVFDGIVRATGTFAFISGMSSMTILAVWAGMFLQTASHTMGDVFLGRAAVLAGLVCGSTSMTRAGLFISVAIIIGVFLLSGMKRVFLVPVVLLMALGTIAMPQGAEDNVVNPYVTLVSTVMERHAKSDSVMDRFDSMNQYLIQSIFEEPMGNGFGVGQVGGAYFATGERKFLRYEQELPRMVSEIGIVGTLGVLMLRIWIIWTLMQACWRLPVGTGQSGLLVCTLSILAFFMQNTAFDHVASGFVWPMLAISLAWAEQQSYLAKQIHQ
ncbi:MAG TPA: hypothetical protein HPQ00_05575, partial [Magnetococcales bacterium]|nr:hypothetical protein [Magnetococcales bacterium]